MERCERGAQDVRDVGDVGDVGDTIHLTFRLAALPPPCSVMGWEHACEWWGGIAAWEVAQSRRVPPPGLQYWTWLAVAERARERRRENWRRLVIRAVAMDCEKWWYCICLCLDVARCVEFQRRREELEELGPELLWVGKRVHFGAL